MNTGSMYPYPQTPPMGPGFGMTSTNTVGMGPGMPMGAPQGMPPMGATQGIPPMGYNSQQLENRINRLERQMRRLEMRISKLETPYQDAMPYQSTQGVDIMDGSFSSMHMM